MSHIIAIIGRPNVGKSTLFNRIIGEQNAIVYDEPGVTRDRHYANAEWCGKNFTLIDTGGYVPQSEDIFEKAIREQAQIAIEEADKIIFVVDAEQELSPLDTDVANILRQSNKKVFLIANKVDSQQREPNIAEFYKLGLGEPISISALNGRKIGDFLDSITNDIPEEETETTDTQLKLAIIGKPNVGKSSLVNALTGKERSIVTPIAGTTRDPIDSILKYHSEEILLVDTAGLMRKSRIRENVDFYSTLRTLKSIERCNIAVILLDAENEIEKQDLRIVQTAVEKKRGVIIAVNKWDTIEKETNTAKKYEEALRLKLRTYNFIPVIFISAKTKQRIFKLIELSKKIHEERGKRISTSELNEKLLPEIQNYPPSTKTGKDVKINYVTQLRTHSPLIAFFANEPQLISDIYKRYLENKIREHFGFEGIPLTIIFKRKRK